MAKSCRLIFAALSILLIGGCSPTPEPTSKADAESIVNSLTYAKNQKTGLCFAIGTYSRISSAASFSEGLVMTEVPCKEVGL